MSDTRYDIDRLPPERQLRLYTDIARRMVRLGAEPGIGETALAVALAAVANVRDAIALLQEHRV